MAANLQKCVSRAALLADDALFPAFGVVDAIAQHAIAFAFDDLQQIDLYLRVIGFGNFALENRVLHPRQAAAQRLANLAHAPDADVVNDNDIHNFEF